MIDSSTLYLVKEQETTMPFQKFTNPATRLNVSGSISSSGILGFSGGARVRYGITSDSYCVLYWDGDTSRIAVELTTDASAEGARKFNVGRHGAVIRAKPFFDFFGIEIEGTLRMPLTQSPDTGWVIFDLKQGVRRKNS